MLVKRWRNACVARSGQVSEELGGTRKIDVFEASSSTWETLPVKLDRAIECGLVVPGRDNEFLIIGGNLQMRLLKNVSAYDLARQTVQCRQPMEYPRSHHKGILYKSEVYVLGGCSDGALEMLDMNELTWHSKKDSLLIPEDLKENYLQDFGYSQAPIVIRHSASAAAQPLPVKGVAHLFGTDNEPKILAVSLDAGDVQARAVPLQMRLFTFQGGVALEEGKYLLFGGIRDFMDKAQRCTAIFNAADSSVVRCGKMRFAGYSFACLLKHPFVYVCGGRQVGSDQQAIINSCQRFQIEQRAWE